MTHRKSPPSLRRHKPSQLGIVTLNGHDHYLGHWPENQKMVPAGVREAYDAIVAEWLANGRHSAHLAPPMSVAELILQFWERYATVYYSPALRPIRFSPDTRRNILLKLGHTAAEIRVRYDLADRVDSIRPNAVRKFESKLRQGRRVGD